MRLFRQTYGSGDPLIIVHGLFGAGGNWASLARKQFGEYFRTIVVDLRNHGRSPHSDVFDYPAMAQDLLELLEDEHLSQAHFLGHSLGGKLAMHLALEHSEVVDRLIVADIAPRAYEPRHELIFRALESIEPSLFESRPEIEAALQPMIPEDGLRQFLMKNLTWEDQEFRWRINLPVIRASYSYVLGVVESWNSFEGDTLFIRGMESGYLSENDLPSIRALFPFAEMKEMAGAGHWLHADDPDLFSDLVLDFLGAS